MENEKRSRDYSKRYLVYIQTELCEYETGDRERRSRERKSDRGKGKWKGAELVPLPRDLQWTPGTREQKQRFLAADVCLCERTCFSPVEYLRLVRSLIWGVMGDVIPASIAN